MAGSEIVNFWSKFMENYIDCQALFLIIALVFRISHIHNNSLPNSPSTKFRGRYFIRKQTARQWQAYEILGTIASDAIRVVFGCFLNGAGKVWVDDFQLFVKNSDGQFEAVEIANPGFEEQGEDDLPKSWTAASPGYRYRISKENPYQGKKCLLIEKQAFRISGQLFERHPGIGEIIDKELGAGLSCQIPLALYSDSSGTLPKSEKHTLESLLSKLRPISTERLTADDESIRLANIIIAWNVFQHFYPYFDVVDVDWDKTLTETLKETLSNQNQNDFYDSLRKMVAKLQDGHGVVFFQPDPPPGGLPIRCEWIENQIVITASEDTSLFKKGDIIKSIDSLGAEQALLNAEELVSGSPQLRRYRALNQFGDGQVGSSIKLELIRNDMVITVATELKKETRNLFANPIMEFDYPAIKKYAGNIYYVNLRKIDPQNPDELLTKLTEAKAVIYDYRWGANRNFSVKDLIPHLISEPVQSARWNIPQVIYPDRENITYDESRWSINPQSPHFKSKRIFIVDASVVSSGETFMGIIEHYKLAEIVGQPTAGCNGNANFIPLLGDYRIMWTGMKVLKHNGSQHHLIGIQPTVPVQRTIQGVREGRDEFLEKALETELN